MVPRYREFRAADGRELWLVIELEAGCDTAYRLEDQGGNDVEEATLSAEDRKLVHAIVFDARCDEQARRADRLRDEREGK